jgi:hypothetical protein
MSLIPVVSEPHLPFLVRRAPSRELSGFVVRMVGYQENGWRLIERSRSPRSSCHW